MTQFKAPSLYNIQFYGEQGNASFAWGTYTFAAAQIADTVDLITMPDGGVLLTSLHMINAALGASSTLGLGWRYQDGSSGGSATALFAQTSTSSAGRISSTAAPIQFEKAVVIYVTVAGAAVTGQIDVIANYGVLGDK